MPNKRTIWLPLILVVLAAVAAFCGQRALRHSKPPEWVLTEPIEKIDAETLELMTLPNDQWDKLGKKLGQFKNPKTGRYTMAEAVKCPHCREKIPTPQVPDAPKLSAEDIKTKRMPAGWPAYQAELEDIWGKYKCPKCGQLWGPYGTPPAF
jgi:rRNA maturation protein Nop10